MLLAGFEAGMTVGELDALTCWAFTPNENSVYTNGTATNLRRENLTSAGFRNKFEKEGELEFHQFRACGASYRLVNFIALQ